MDAALLYRFVVFVCALQLPTFIAGYDDPYIHEATTAPTTLQADYIIVGGGTAGCPLAATLSQKYSVLVLERGGVPYDQPSVYRIEGFPYVLATRASQPFRSVEGVQNRRGYVLGGGSSVNAGFYSRAAPDFIEVMGWNATAVAEAYEWAEEQIVFEPELGPWNSAFRDGLLEAGVTPFNGPSLEHIVGTKIGNSIFDNNGTRHTAADLLRAGNPDNLNVLIYAVVTQIIFYTGLGTDPIATGVWFTDSNGDYHTAMLKEGGEVLLTAGALGTPQLLLLSGVGPADELQAMNIPVVLDSPRVGKNITDIPINSINILSPTDVETSSLELVGISEYENIFEGASGGNHTVCWGMAGAMTTVPPINRTDELTEQSTTLINALPDFIKNDLNRAGFVLSKVYLPRSRGDLWLNTTDINDNPVVQYNYYADQHDLDVCINGSKVLHKLLNSTPFQPYRTTDIPFILSLIDPALANLEDGEYEGAVPPLPNSDNYTEAAQWCKDTMNVIWHFHGGCHVGEVVDEEYRVMGTRSLRVVDGSLWPTSPGTNPMATVIILGRIMGLKLLSDREAAV